MFQDVVIINGPVWKDGVSDYERVYIKARPLGRPYDWNNAPPWNNDYATNGGFRLVFEAEDGAVYIQEIEWEIDGFPSSDPNPRTYYYYEKYNSLAEAREGWRGWLIEQALRYEDASSSVTLKLPLDKLWSARYDRDTVTNRSFRRLTMRRILPRYEIWVGEEHKEHELLEIRAERLGEYVDRGERRSLIYRVYRKANGNVLVHVYDRADVPGEIDRASLFEYDDLETAAQCGFRPALQKMNLI